MSSSARPPAMGSAPAQPAQPAQPDQMKQYKDIEECILLGPTPGQVIGGQRLGYPQNIRTNVSFHRPDTARPHLAIRLYFPRRASVATFHNAEGKATDTHVVTIKLYAGTWTSQGDRNPTGFLERLPTRSDKGKDKPLSLIVLNLKDGQKPGLEGFGFPCVLENPDHDSALNLDTPLAECGMTIWEICAMRQFRLLTTSRLVPRAQQQFAIDFPSPAPDHLFSYSLDDWGMATYQQDITRDKTVAPYTLRSRLDKVHDAAVSIVQGVVQDVFYLSADVGQIRSHPVRCLFIRTATGVPDNEANEFMVLVRHGLNKDTYGMSLNRLLKGDAQFGLAFKLPPPRSIDGPDIDNDYWRARQIPLPVGAPYDLAMMIQRPVRGDPGFEVRDQAIGALNSILDAQSATTRKEAEQEAYLRFDAGLVVAKRRVDGVLGALRDREMERGKSIDDFIQGYEVELLHRCKAELFAGSGFNTLLTKPQPRFSDAFPPAVLGPLMIERGLRRESAVLPGRNILGGIRDDVRKALRAFRPDMYERVESFFKITRLGIVPIMGFAGSGKTEFLALVAVMFILCQKIRNIFCAAPTHVATSNFARRLDDIYGKVMRKLPTGTPVFTPVIIRGYTYSYEVKAFRLWGDTKSADAVPDLADPYHPPVWAPHLSTCQWLLRVIKPAKLKDNFPPRLQSVREQFDGARYRGLRQFVQGAGDYSDAGYDDGEKGFVTPDALVVELLIAMVSQADAVCTTPHGSEDRLYRMYKKGARGIVLDEAGAMLQADMALVWGPGSRPCAMAGDHHQLPPTIISKGANRDGKCYNHFELLARESALEKIMSSGWPCIVLTRQFRIAHGCFDLAREIIYHDIKDVDYAPSASLKEHKQLPAVKIENWARTQYKAAPSPPGSVLPLFFHCPGVGEQDTTTSSMFNAGQISLAVSLAAGLIKAAIVKGQDIVAITPYRSNLARLQAALAAHEQPGCSDVVVNTTDSFQGREGILVILVLCVTRATGVRFVGDANRICVGLTRHQCALFVVGDINTVPPTSASADRQKALRVERLEEGEDGGRVRVKNLVFSKMLDYFRNKNRVVHVSEDGTLVARAPGPSAKPGPPQDEFAGSGKMAAYLIPILNKLMGKAKKLAAAPRPGIDTPVRAEPLVVIVCPSRELAVQIN
ncbi:P-loop containing nucleoside triphosphate hydrolase protein [Lasiosphaeria ovina]|uniref:P-loop containing nucleoside triphosphate hydrolase protein n=1 Tax=Lasiosphaeria ovina TaxID=92902 RepID=A0AAE0MXQ4_9PEZI|nr:P-loop containing nucleoside triphosphate hydrolase protein [Lasiosphaeria ovina]